MPPGRVLALQIRQELVGEVHGHAVSPGLHDLTHLVFGCHTPCSDDEALGMEAVDQLWRHRVRSRTELAQSQRSRLRDRRITDLGHEPAARQFGCMGSRFLQPCPLKKGDGDLAGHPAPAHQVRGPLRQMGRVPLDLRVEVRPPLISFEDLLERGDSLPGELAPEPGDRKSTRLNSSHSQISYAVFCLKKKKKKQKKKKTKKTTKHKKTKHKTKTQQ